MPPPPSRTVSKPSKPRSPLTKLPAPSELRKLKLDAILSTVNERAPLVRRNPTPPPPSPSKKKGVIPKKSSLKPTSYPSNPPIENKSIVFTPYGIGKVVRCDRKDDIIEIKFFKMNATGYIHKTHVVSANESSRESSEKTSHKRKKEHKKLKKFAKKMKLLEKKKHKYAKQMRKLQHKSKKRAHRLPNNPFTDPTCVPNHHEVLRSVEKVITRTARGVLDPYYDKRRIDKQLFKDVIKSVVRKIMSKHEYWTQDSLVRLRQDTHGIRKLTRQYLHSHFARRQRDRALAKRKREVCKQNIALLSDKKSKSRKKPKAALAVTKTSKTRGAAKHDEAESTAKPVNKTIKEGKHYVETQRRLGLPSRRPSPTNLPMEEPAPVLHPSAPTPLRNLHPSHRTFPPPQSPAHMKPHQFPP